MRLRQHRMTDSIRSALGLSTSHLRLQTDPAALQDLHRQLDIAGVPNNGVEDDPLTGGTYISFYDPDGIAWELYALTSRL